ncbi:MAG TPA: class I SAM-dependent methyltransferase, partial [Pseudolabrys sp.]|nr:class I SAM-dependent methyltransferase [Pseudolabrys sp.]
TSEAVKQLYDHYYDSADFGISQIAAASLDRLVESIEPFRQTNRWLDIGYGEGGLLDIAGRHGWDCYGSELSPQALSYGQDRGWAVTANAQDDTRFPKGGFDVVTMIEFIEHAHAPARFLQAAAAWLRPGGLLYITTPNGQSLNRRLLGLEWSVFSPPEHVTIWTAHGLCLALTRAGFQARRIRTDGLNPTEIVARFLRKGQASPSVDRNTAAFALNSAFSSSPFRRAVKAGINRCLSAFRLGDTLKVWAVRNVEEERLH